MAGEVEYIEYNPINFTKQALDYLDDDGVLVIVMPTPKAVEKVLKKYYNEFKKTGQV